MCELSGLYLVFISLSPEGGSVYEKAESADRLAHEERYQ